jgi:signal transduction histidine kinase
MQTTDLQYHRERATRELEMGLIAGNLTASRAHLKLAAMHMGRVKQLASTAAEAASPLEM